MVGNLLVDTARLKSELLPSPSSCLAQVEAMLPRVTLRKSEALYEDFDAAVKRLGKPRYTVDEFVEHLEYMDNFNGDVELLVFHI